MTPERVAYDLLTYWRARATWSDDAREYVAHMLNLAERGPLAALYTDAGRALLERVGVTL